MSAVIPIETPETAYLWEGYRSHELLLQQCGRCGLVRFLPAMHCAACSSPEWEPRAASGEGTVFSYVITRRPEGLPVVDDFPVVALVELAEGVRLVSNVSGITPEDVRIGLPVRAYYDDVIDDSGERSTLVRFRPAASGAAA